MEFCLATIPHNPESHCTYGNETTGILGGNIIDFAYGQLLGNGLTNPIKFPFFGEWPSQFGLFISVFDEDTDDDELIDNYMTTVQIEPGTSEQSSSWKSLILQGEGQHTDMASQVKVYCAEDWYDRHCNTFCHAAPEDHYTCDYQTGSKICKLGWVGLDCNQPVCTTGCSPIHGSCTQPRECICEEHWSGRLCDKCIPAEGCVNGHCIVGNDCHCEDETWTGQNCDIDLNPCRSNPCENGASCSNSGPNNYTCQCALGFTGINCEIDIDECASSPCLNGATCLDKQGFYECECSVGFQGAHCETEINYCYVENKDGKLIPTGVCGSYGNCVNTPTSFVCDCHKGFTGDICDTNMDDCQHNHCKHGSTCVDGIDRYHCKCTDGYEGHHCEREIDECMSAPCNNGGTCVDDLADYFCVCPKGWEGKDCGKAAPEDCIVNGKVMPHNFKWEDDCNGCYCDNGDIVCSKIWCGPDNCVASNDEPSEYHVRILYTCPPDAPCTPQPGYECLLGQCDPFGECRNEKKGSVQDARCGTSSFKDRAGSYACTYVGMKLDYDILPQNTSVEDVCYELRRIHDLRPHAMKDKLVILCDRDIVTMDNVIYVSTESGSGPEVTQDAMNELTGYVMSLPEDSNNLILKSIYDIFIPSTYSERKQDSGTNIWLPVFLILLALVLLAAIICFAVWYRRRKQKKEKHVDHPLSRLTLKMRENPFFEEKDEVDEYGMTTMSVYMQSNEQCSSADADYELDVISLSSQSDTGCQSENQDADNDYMSMDNNTHIQIPEESQPLRENDDSADYV
ncbi:delta-like protein D isoform X2 [Ptychodera flava]